MGRFLDGFKKGLSKVDTKMQELQDKKVSNNEMANLNQKKFRQQKDNMQNLGNLNDGLSDDDFYGDDFDDFNDMGTRGRGFYDEVGVQPAQKPESFHHFILENQYKDLEKSIRGYKDVFDKETNTWKVKRKDVHCFTDEEAEDILRTAQSHLATDIKLGWIRKEVFGLYMDAVYKEVAFLFESIAEYRYGRYGDYDTQYNMKLQNQKVFLELWTRIQMNYSRAIDGSENKSTHQSVKGQESLQSGERDITGKNRGYF
jgi:hypothetical protein